MKTELFSEERDKGVFVVSDIEYSLKLRTFTKTKDGKITFRPTTFKMTPGSGRMPTWCLTKNAKRLPKVNAIFTAKGFKIRGLGFAIVPGVLLDGGLAYFKEYNRDNSLSEDRKVANATGEAAGGIAGSFVALGPATAIGLGVGLVHICDFKP